MILDGVFLKGYSHETCQDYCLVSENRVVISDGCSSAKDSDVGSRIMALSSSINNAIAVAQSLNLELDTLLATKLSLTIVDNIARVDIKGDGFVLYKIDDKIVLENYLFPSGAPYYPLYAVDKERKLEWISEFGDQFIIEKTIDDSSEKLAIQLDENFSGIVKEIKGAEWVFIGSDGLFSFNSSVSQIVQEISDLKIKNGRFLYRRISKMLKKFKKMGIDHYDDFSIGGVWF